MNYDVNMVEEVRRLDAVHNGQRRFLYAAPLLAILALGILFWLLPEVFSTQSPAVTQELQVTSQSASSREERGNATAIQQSSPVPSATAAADTMVSPTEVPISTENALAATQDVWNRAVQDAIRGTR
jgi:hypothetical protein